CGLQTARGGKDKDKERTLMERVGASGMNGRQGARGRREGACAPCAGRGAPWWQRGLVVLMALQVLTFCTLAFQAVRNTQPQQQPPPHAFVATGAAASGSAGSREAEIPRQRMPTMLREHRVAVELDGVEDTLEQRVEQQDQEEKTRLEREHEDLVSSWRKRVRAKPTRYGESCYQGPNPSEGRRSSRHAEQDLHGPGMYDEAKEAGLGEAVQGILQTAPNCYFDEPAYSVSEDGVEEVQASAERARADRGGFCFPERNGGATCVGDFDNDGLVDVVLTSFTQPMHLFRNLGDGHFEDVSATHLVGLPRVEDGGRTNGCALVDLDNDGSLDLVVTSMAGSRHFVFMNDGHGRFSEQAERRGARVTETGDGSPTSGGSVIVGDYDGDGWVDLLFTEWRQQFLVEPNNPHARPEGNSRLLRNVGNGHFEDATERANLNFAAHAQERMRAMVQETFRMRSADLGANSATFDDADIAGRTHQAFYGFTDGVYTFGGQFVDLDGDGALDLIVTADFGTHQLFWNNGNGTFTEADLELAGLDKVENAMGLSVADVDGDGLQDLYITSIRDKRPKDRLTSFGTLGNFFYRNNGDRTFADWTQRLSVRDGHWSWGAALVDLNNDGHLDLFATNGYTMPETTFEDTFNISPNKLWMNHGPGTRWEETEETLLHPTGHLRQGRGVAVLDVDRSGSMDVLVVNNAEAPYLYRNRMSQDNDWVQVVAYERNRVALGAVVTVTHRGTPQTAVMGAVTGFQGQSEAMVHFGLGRRFGRPIDGVSAQTIIDSIKVFWPASNKTVVLNNVQANRRVLVNEPGSSVAPLEVDAASMPECGADDGGSTGSNTGGSSGIAKTPKDESALADGLEHLPPLEPLSLRMEKLMHFMVWQLLHSNRTMEFRSFDGRGNNVQHPTWGAAGTALGRRVENAYADRVSKPAQGKTRPSPRELSNALCAEAEYTASAPSENGLSDLAVHFGQFLAHDTDHTTPMANTKGEEYFPILVPKGDPVFDPEGTGQEVMRLRRSIFDPDTGTSRYNPRQQVNKVTAFVDASTIYGVDEERANHLRMHRDGLLRIGPNNSLPHNVDGAANDNPLGRKTQSLHVSGDARANIQPGLFALHTLFHREHNYLARHFKRVAKLKFGNFTTLTDDELFFLARRLLIIELQSITYNEYIPALLGESLPFKGYDPEVNPAIFNTFSSAAFRFGHSQANNEFWLADHLLQVNRKLLLNESYFDPQPELVDDVIRGLVLQKGRKIDLTMSDNLRNHLLGPRAKGGVDLAAINIQRGRDHGLNHFNAIRASFQLQPFVSFEEFSAQNKTRNRVLEQAYKGDIDDIDAFVGLLAEDHVEG
ncbi:Peroxinectin A, partial [Durusdinium trenchii]